MKKNLLIFFGEYRTFEYIIPQLDRLNEVDIIFSTWDYTLIRYFFKNENLVKSLNINPLIDETNIKTILSNCTPIIHKKNSVIYNEMSDLNKMHFHWLEAINAINDNSKYDKLVLHRCDMVSNWDTLLDRNFEKDTIYIDGGYPRSNSENNSNDNFWIGDYIIAGNFDVMKKFINLFKDNTYITRQQTEPHFYLGKAILENNFKWNYLNLNTFLVRYDHIELFDKLNKSDVKFLNLKKGCDDWKSYYELIGAVHPPY